MLDTLQQHVTEASGAGDPDSMQDGAAQGGALLVVYFAKEHPLRQTIEHSVSCFARYSGRPCIYLNAAVRGVPRWLRRLPLDLVIFHTTLLSVRWNPEHFEHLMKRIAALKLMGRARAALPQDEYIHTGALCRFLNEFRVTHVFSSAAPGLWGQIYPSVDRTRVRFSTVLTGYLDPQTASRLDQASRTSPRPIDIGYRAKNVPHSLGEHGHLKVEIASRVIDAAAARGLILDISTEPGDTFYGDAWTDFLLSCKSTIGVEGGASVLDTDGSILQAASRFHSVRPEASFAETKRACFADRDGEFDLRAISPRHLEACATRTCQILIEGDYNGILKPHEHYIPIKRDFSNLDAALELATRERARHTIVEQAWRDIVASGKYGYDRYVAELLERCRTPHGSVPAAPVRPVLLRWAVTADRLSWIVVRARQKLVRLLESLGLKSQLRRLLPRRSGRPCALTPSSKAG